MDRHLGRLRELRPCDSRNCICGAFLPVFLWPVMLICLAPSPYLVHQDPADVHTSLGQDGAYQRGLWVEHPLASLPFDLQGAFLCMCGQGGLLTWRMKTMWSEQGPVSCLNCLAVLILEFWSTGNESPIQMFKRARSCRNLISSKNWYFILL